MLYRHRHLSQQFIKYKKTNKITIHQPLVLLISKKYTYLNSFIINCLNFKKISFQLRYHQQQNCMNLQLPALAYRNYILTQQNLIQFISDILLSQQSYQIFIQRKTIIKQQYFKWNQIIKEQYEGLVNYKSLQQIGINNQQDYYNHIFTQYLTIISWIKTDLLQRKYPNFKRKQINLENLFIFDLIKSVLELCTKTKLQYVLRSNYEELIDFKDQLNVKIRYLNQIELNQRVQSEVITQKIDNQIQPIYPNLTLNHKKFAIAFAIITAIYLKWVN